MAVDTPAKTQSSAYLPDGRLKWKASIEDRDELLEQAAEMAVDMEEGRYLKPDGSPWTGPYYKNVIAEAMGFSKPHNGEYSRGGGKGYPVWMNEPGFSNWVQFERIKRTAHARMTMDEAKPLVAVGAGAMLLEMVKRALTAPDTIGNRELFLETRKWVELLASIDDHQEDRSDPRTVINNFFVSVERLPKEAREKAMALFETDLTRLTSAAKRPKVIEAKARKAS